MSRLEYRMQLCLLSRNACNELQGPILKLIKNKADMPYTAPNAAFAHKNIAEVTMLWQNQLIHHFTEVLARLNNNEEVGKATWMRIKQAQLNIRSRQGITELDPEDLDQYNFKNNLNAKIIQEAKRLDINISTEELKEELTLCEEGTEVRKIIDKKFLEGYIQGKNLNIIVVEQLIDKNGTKLLSWEQMKLCRNAQAKGRIANWFKNLEDKMLEDRKTRTIKEEFRKTQNSMFIMPELAEISFDKRKQEWIILKKGGGRETQIGKITKKMKGSQHKIEHWKKISKDDQGLARFSLCTGCKYTQKIEDNRCIMYKKFTNIKRALNRLWVCKEREEEEAIYKIKVPWSNLTNDQVITEIPEERGKREVSSVNIHLGLLSEKLIRNANQEEEVTRELLEAAQKIQDEEVFNIYTDGSLFDKHEEAEKARMGIGWVITTKEDETEKIKVQFQGRLREWPSATRAELGAIWSALLVVPRKAQVTINTDSLAAIKAIEKTIKNRKLRSNFKTKNVSILTQIRQLTKIKEIALNFYKIKSHSGNKLNDEADQLAKEGAKSNKLLQISWPWNTIRPYTLKWKQYIIESLIWEFVKRVTTSVQDAEWAGLTRLEGATDRVDEEEVDWRET